MIPSEQERRRLETLRTLIERAPAYRAWSGPTALVAGLLSLGGFATAYYAKHYRHVSLSYAEFRMVWLTILLLTLFANFFFGRAAAGGTRFFSAERRLAWRCLAPAGLGALVLTCADHHPIQVALGWITFYGLALLGTQAFAPRSLIVLGSAFFVTGLGLLPTWRHFLVPPERSEPSALVVSGLLAGTFGGFHLVYAVVLWSLGAGRDRGGPPLQTKA